MRVLLSLFTDAALRPIWFPVPDSMTEAVLRSAVSSQQESELNPQRCSCKYLSQSVCVCVSVSLSLSLCLFLCLSLVLYMYIYINALSSILALPCLLRAS